MRKRLTSRCTAELGKERALVARRQLANVRTLALPALVVVGGCVLHVSDALLAHYTRAVAVILPELVWIRDVVYAGEVPGEETQVPVFVGGGQRGMVSRVVGCHCWDLELDSAAGKELALVFWRYTGRSVRGWNAGYHGDAQYPGV